MAADTQQNIIYAAYFILLHNFEAILYTLGIITAALWAFYKPSRSILLIMWGCIILLFAFEYKKHIVDGLREQTVNSLVTERQSWRIERYIDIVLLKLAPRALPLLGWMSIIGGFLLKRTHWDTGPLSTHKKNTS
jgi:hypothetical protein